MWFKNEVRKVGVWKPELVFANLLRSPGIDSQPGGPVLPPFLSYQLARLHRLAESIPELHIRLQIRAQGRRISKRILYLSV